MFRLFRARWCFIHLVFLHVDFFHWLVPASANRFEWHTRGRYTAGDTVGNKKGHTRNTYRDTMQQDGIVAGREVDFCQSHGTRNAARKRISPINCQSNLVTQKITLSRFYDLPHQSSLYFVCSRLSSHPAPKKARPGSLLPLDSLSLPSGSFGPCHLSYNRVYCRCVLSTAMK